MPRDVNGTYTLPTNDSSPAAPRNVIRSSDFNELTSDYATALTDSFSRSGKGAALADLDMDGFDLLNPGNLPTNARTLNAGTGIATIGDLSADRTIALNAASIASLALADTASQARANVAAMQSISTAVYDRVQYAGSTWSTRTASDYTAAIAADTQNGVFIQSTFDATKVWVREHTGFIFVDWFGAGTSVSAANNLARIQVAINVAKTIKTALLFGYGTYSISGSLSLSGCSDTAIIGVGQGSKISTTSATLPIFITTSDAEEIYRFNLRDVYLSASVTRTGVRPFLEFTSWFYYSNFSNIYADNWNSFAWFKRFVQINFDASTLYQMTSPPVLTYGFALGQQAAGNQGANFDMDDVLLRGGTTGSTTETDWSVGLILYDVEGIFTDNVDIGTFDMGVRCDPQTRLANCFFDSTFFDSTHKGATFKMQGSGIKVEIEFGNSWFASAGVNGGGASFGAYGLIAVGTGSYGRIMFTGCRWYNNAGNAVAITASAFDADFVGCRFEFNSYIDHGPQFFCSTTGKAPSLKKCTFGQTDPAAPSLNYTGGTDYDIDIAVDRDVTLGGTPRSAIVTGSTNSRVLASAATVTLLAWGDFFTISGTTTITAIAASTEARVVSLLFQGALQLTHSANLVLKGAVNATTANGNIITFLYNGSGVWREVSRNF